MDLIAPIDVFLSADLNALRDAYDEDARQWSDAQLIAAIADVIAIPKEAPADSFVLHAPLELLARATLLPQVDPERRAEARLRLLWLGATYATAAASLPVSGHDRTRSGPTGMGDAVSHLLAALDSGDLDDVDYLSMWVGQRATPAEMAEVLADSVVASLAAAGHASILLDLLPRVPEATPVTATLLRGPARELARHPEWRLRWFEDPTDSSSGNPQSGSLLDALADIPMLGLPGSNFIFPIMQQAEESGIAAKLLAGVATGDPDPTRVRLELSRVAAWSMLQEPPDHAPYGWSHCLTMPQSVLGLAGRGATARRAVAVAATHVVGFRAAMAQRVLDPAFVPPLPATGDMAEALTLGRLEAAATVWHASEADLATHRTLLATRAALHHDAHLAKYTLACFDAAKRDPSQPRLHLAAAASLSAWWAALPDDGLLPAASMTVDQR